jgi:hypothetical protein
MTPLYKLAIYYLRFAYIRIQELTPTQGIPAPEIRTMSIPSTHRALTVVERGDKATNKPGKVEVQEHPVPALKEDGVLVRVKSVALNPTDWKVILPLYAFLVRQGETLTHLINQSKYTLTVLLAIHPAHRLDIA